jgi:hypothetical protein
VVFLRRRTICLRSVLERFISLGMGSGRRHLSDPFLLGGDSIGSILANETIGSRSAYVCGVILEGQKSVFGLFDERENYPRPVRRIECRKS